MSFVTELRQESGARRDEIRRLAVDCLDTYPDKHPRRRIPVGKGYAERMIPRRRPTTLRTQ